MAVYSLSGAQLRSRVEDNIARPDKATTIYDWLNEAQRYLIRRCMSVGYEIRELMTDDTTNYSTTADTKTLTIPTDTATIYTIRVIDSTNSRALIQKTARWMDESHPYPEDESTGIPVYYVPFATYIEFFPIPDDTYPVYIRYLQWPSRIVAATTSLDLVGADEIIIAIATWLGYQHLMDENAIVFWHSIIEGTPAERTQSDTPAGLIGAYISGETHKEDYRPQAEEFTVNRQRGGLPGDYWADPFVRRV